MKHSFEKIADALDEYDAEMAAWRLVPIQSTEYNDKGILKYRMYWVLDDCRRLDIAEDPPATATYVRLELPLEDARMYVRHKAMTKAAEVLLTPDNR